MLRDSLKAKWEAFHSKFAEEAEYQAMLAILAEDLGIMADQGKRQASYSLDDFGMKLLKYDETLRLCDGIIVLRVSADECEEDYVSVYWPM